MAVNITAVKTASNGVWQGDNPLHFAFPLLVVQTILVLLLSRVLAFALKPLRQPNVIAEIIGGILLGPSAFGRNEWFHRTFFPAWSTAILETTASIGLLFFLFLVGLELDLASIRRSGRRAFYIAAAGISLPFVCGIGVAFVLRDAVPGADVPGYAPFLVFMGVALSITAFPVLARILAELKLLTTPVGETAMAAAAFNDVAAWVLLALAVALSNGSGDGHKSPLISLWVLLSGLVFVAFMMLVIKPVMKWVARRSEEGQSELYVCLTLGGVLASGFATDVIGIHAIFGAFVFGLTIPKEGDFAGRMIERIEDFVSGLLLPLYFASSGLKTDVTKISGARAWGLLVLVVTTACFGKIIGTFVVARACKVPTREAIALGVLMNTKGLVELIVLNIGKERKVLNEEIFAILVLMALFTTFVTTPTVMAIFKPARRGPRPANLHRRLPGGSGGQREPSKELPVLACIHARRDVPAIMNLVEIVRGGTRKSPLKLYIMHLVELTERPSSIAMALRARRNGLPFRNPLRKETRDEVLVAFEAYGQLGRVKVRPMTAVSSMATMHEDVCGVADEKKVSLIMLPFHKHKKGGGGDDAAAMEQTGAGWRPVNQRVMEEAPCSVAVLVDRGFGGGEQVLSAEVSHGVCVIFLGGPDDREALALTGRMAEHPGVTVTVVRFVEGGSTELNGGMLLIPSLRESNGDSYGLSMAMAEKALDEAAIEEFQRRTEGLDATVEETTADGKSILEAVHKAIQSRPYELVVVGKGRFPSTLIAGLGERHAEHPELGPIGDALASSDSSVSASVLVVQQHDAELSQETPESIVVDVHEHVASASN